MADSADSDTQIAMQVIDEGTAPTTYIDGIHGISIQDGCVVCNLTRTVVPATTAGAGAPKIYIETVERLVMPFAAFERITDFFSRNLSQFKSITPGAQEGSTPEAPIEPQAGSSNNE